MLLEFHNGKFNITDIKFGEHLIEDSNFTIFYYGILSRNVTEKQLKDSLTSNPNTKSLEDYFNNGYFVVTYDKGRNSITMRRDRSGIKTGYYYIEKENLLISTNMHQIAAITKASFSPVWIDSYIYNHFIFDGYTFYNNIFEVNIGEYIQIELNTFKKNIFSQELPILYEEANLTEQQCIQELRNKTLKTFDRLYGDNNVVYLSGGIDSCVILAALYNVCPDKLRCVSYCVKDGKQNETIYAKYAADFLSTKLDIIEVDPNTPDLVQNFESIVLQQNLPYDGMCLFEPQKQADNEFFFAGQDTRLHTPAVGVLELTLMNSIINQSKSLNVSTDNIIHLLVELQRKGINIHRFIASLCNNEAVLNYAMFSLSQAKYKLYNFNPRHLTELLHYTKTNFEHKSNLRTLYNDMVAVRWKKQYTNDIRYMVDMGNRKQCHILLPFYDPKLAEFSSTLPWDYATKRVDGFDKFSQRTVSVDKFILRKAFEKEISDKVLFRAKATSDDYLLMYQGTLKKVILQILNDDLSSTKSFLREYGFNEYVQKNIFNNPNWALHYRECKTSLNTAICCVLFANINKV